MRKKSKKDDHRYITNQQAQYLTGLGYWSLLYHVRKGNIRGRRLASGRRGPPPLHLHIDDVRIYTHPTLIDIARQTGLTKQYLYYLVRNWSLPGLHRFGVEYRIDPGYVSDWLKWLVDGRPVRPPFVPLHTSTGGQNG